MRSLKFRAWDKIGKQMIPAIYIFVNGPGVVWENRRDGIEDNDTLVASTEFELMQFTGLKDKNGELIYEGDIVKHSIFGVKEITWGNKAEKALSDCCGFMYNKTIAFLSGHDTADVEVIGNIYENPELLK